MFDEEDIVKSHQGRGYLIFYFIGICFSVLVARLWYLQIYRGDIFYNFSVKNSLRKEIVRGGRGFLIDRFGRLMVSNENRYDLMIIPQYLQNKEETLKRVSEIIGISVERIEKSLARFSTQAKYKPVRIKKNIPMEEVALIETQNQVLPGVIVEPFTSRYYSDGEVGAHVLGYISEMNQSQLPMYSKRDGVSYHMGDFIGQSGVEEVMDRELRGENGINFVEVDARGRKTKFMNTHHLFPGIENIPEKQGHHVFLTLDRDLQNVAQKELTSKVGAVVAMNVHTGELLTMISAPSFDASRFSKGLTHKYWDSLLNDPNKPLWGRMLQEHYSPGSTFKIISAIALLEEGIISPQTRVHCTGSFQFGNRKYHCWKRGGHGYMNIVGAIRESCNIFFQKMMENFDIDILAKYATAFGFGHKTGVELPREARGLIPTKEWKKKRTKEVWHQGETLSCSIGQSYILSSLLQLVVSYSAVANGGKILKPQIIKKVVSNDHRVIKEFEPVILKETGVTEDSLKLVERGLKEVMNDPRGTGFRHADKKLKIAGKTGTSQVVGFDAEKIYMRCEDHEYDKRHHGLIVAYAPYDAPEIALSVLVEHGCHGSSVGIPIVNAIVKKYFENKGRIPKEIPWKE